MQQYVLQCTIYNWATPVWLFMNLMRDSYVLDPVVTYTARLGLGTFAQCNDEDWYLSGMVRQADDQPLVRLWLTGSGYAGILG
jgi:hypothetical protein